MTIEGANFGAYQHQYQPYAKPDFLNLAGFATITPSYLFHHHWDARRRAAGRVKSVHECPRAASPTEHMFDAARRACLSAPSLLVRPSSEPRQRQWVRQAGQQDWSAIGDPHGCHPTKTIGRPSRAGRNDDLAVDPINVYLLRRQERARRA